MKTIVVSRETFTCLEQGFTVAMSVPLKHDAELGDYELRIECNDTDDGEAWMMRAIRYNTRLNDERALVHIDGNMEEVAQRTITFIVRGTST